MFKIRLITLIKEDQMITVETRDILNLCLLKLWVVFLSLYFHGRNGAVIKIQTWPGLR